MPSRKINSLPFLYHPFRLLCAIYHRLYYRRFKVMGKANIPTGVPLIFACCHQNALMDALAVLFGYGRQVVFLARADIFRNKLIASLLRFIRILPLYRIRDGYSTLSQNQATFDEVNQVIRQKIPIGIFPEGYHLGMKRLKPLRKGIARMAFRAESEADFKLGLQIVPVGLDYSDYYKAGSDLLVIFGKPLKVADYKEKYLQNPAIGMNGLLEDLAMAMRDLMIDIRPEEGYEEIKKAAENYADAQIYKQHIRKNLQNRFFLVKQATERLTGAYTKGLLIFNELRDEMTSHNEMSSHFKIITRFILLILLFPLSLYGAFINSVPFFIPSKLTRKIKDPHFISSVRFGAGFLMFIFWYFLLTLLIVFLFDNIFLILGLLISLPLSALISVYYFRLMKRKSV